MTNTPITLPFYAKSTIVLIGIVVSIYMLYIGNEILVPLIFALFISILLNPMVNWMVRKKVPKIVAISLALMVAVLFILALVAVIAAQFAMVAKTYPQLRGKFDSSITQYTDWIAAKVNTDPAAILAWLKTTQHQALNSLSNSMGSTLMTVGNAFVVIFLVPVYVFLILLYKPLFLEVIRKLFDPQHHKTVVEVLASIKTIIQSYLAGLLIETVVVAVLNSVALLVLGVEYAIILGVTGALLNLIPYIGGIIGFGIPMIIALLTKSPLTALLVFITYSVIQFIDNHYLVPSVVASKVKVNALIAIIVVIMGGMLWGVPGMFLSIPLTALLKVIFDHIPSLHPWGLLIGDDIPTLVKLPFSTPKTRQKKALQ